MKSLLFALLLFAVVVYGCFDVKPFRPIRRVLRRIPGGRTGPLRSRTGPLEDPEEALTGTGPLPTSRYRR